MASSNMFPNINSGKIVFSPEDCDKIAQSLAFTKVKYRENIIVPKLFGQGGIKSDTETMIEATVESCAFKSMMSCVIGMRIFHLNSC